MRERFFNCIDTLVEADPKAHVKVGSDAPDDCSTLPIDASRTVVPGFAIVALCCLLAETLQVFRRETNKKGKTEEQFKAYLRRPAFGNAFADEKIAEDFARGVRHAILHEAETRRWTIQLEIPAGKIVDHDGQHYRLNRTEFYKALCVDFEDYVAELSDEKNSDLRKRFIDKMNEIAKLC
jgi:hypothetical protein